MSRVIFRCLSSMFFSCSRHVKIMKISDEKLQSELEREKKERNNLIINKTFFGQHFLFFCYFYK